MDKFLQGLMDEFPEGGVPTMNNYQDSLALYQRSRDLSTEALRMQTGVDSIYKNAEPKVKRGVFQEAVQNANEFFGQYPTYKPIGYKPERAGDRSVAIPVYAKPKGGQPVADNFLDGLKTEFPLP
jgi:hypothetical protein